MENNKKRRTGTSIILILLIILTLVSTGIGLYAWAKYKTTIGGTASEEVAKWSFKVVDGNTETADILDFPITRTDNNTDVAANTIAPGTYGKFEIDIDARETETVLTYIIDIAFENKPENLKFYSDETMTNEIELNADNNLVISEVLSLDDVQYIQPNIIYWNWAYETGTTASEKRENNILDTQYMGKQIKMNIAVTGTQGEQYIQEENPMILTIINGETNEHSNLQDAIDFAGNNIATIKFMKNRVISGATINANQNITIDLNGRQITTSELITNNGSLTIEDSSTYKTGKLTTSNYISQLGIFTLNSGKIEGNDKYDTIKANNQNSHTIINGGTINNTSTGNYVCLLISKGNLTITNGFFNSRYRCFHSSSNTNIIHISGGEFNAIGNIDCSYQALAGYIYAAKELKISGGTFKGASGEGTHGSWAIQIGSNVQSASITGGTFQGGTLGFRTGSNLTISNATIKSGYGCIEVYNNANLTINEGVNINANTFGITNNGTGKVTMNNGLITAKDGIINKSTGTIELNNGNLTASNNGITVGSGVFNFNGGTIKSKNATIDGTPTIKSGFTRVDETDSSGYKVTYLTSN